MLQWHVQFGNFPWQPVSGCVRMCRVASGNAWLAHLFILQPCHMDLTTNPIYPRLAVTLLYRRRMEALYNRDQIKVRHMHMFSWALVQIPDVFSADNGVAILNASTYR